MKYIGIDVHSSTCTFCVLDERGVEIDNVTMETNGRHIVGYISSIEGKKAVAIEECELSSWMYSLLDKRVDRLMVCNPVINRQYKGPKNDRIDAKRLAKLYKGGYLEGVYHNGSNREDFRILMSGYQDIIQEGVKLKCRYKSLYRREGRKITGENIYSDENLIEGLKKTESRFIGRSIFKALKCFESIRKECIEEIKKKSKGFKEIKYLKSIPGIKDINAAKIVSQVIDPRRFKNKNKYYSYCGLARHEKKSAGKDYGSIKIHGNMTLKNVYKTAAHIVLKGNSGLRKYYDMLRLKGINHEDAKNAVSRKIAILSLSVWRHNQKYNDKQFIEKHLKKDKGENIKVYC